MRIGHTPRKPGNTTSSKSSIELLRAALRFLSTYHRHRPRRWLHCRTSCRHFSRTQLPSSRIRPGTPMTNACLCPRCLGQWRPTRHSTRQIILTRAIPRMSALRRLWPWMPTPQDSNTLSARPGVYQQHLRLWRRLLRAILPLTPYRTQEIVCFPLGFMERTPTPTLDLCQMAVINLSSMAACTSTALSSHLRCLTAIRILASMTTCKPRASVSSLQHLTAISNIFTAIICM